MVTASFQSIASNAQSSHFVLLDTMGASVNLLASSEKRVYVLDGTVYRAFPGTPRVVKYYAGKKVSPAEMVRGKRHKCVCARTGHQLVCIGTLTEVSTPSRHLIDVPQAPQQAIASQPPLAETPKTPKTASAPQESSAVKKTPGRKKSSKPVNVEMQQAFENVIAQKNAGHDPHIKGELVRWILNISKATLSRYQNTGQVPKPKKIPGAKTNYWLLSEILSLKKE